MKIQLTDALSLRRIFLNKTKSIHYFWQQLKRIIHRNFNTTCVFASTYQPKNEHPSIRNCNCLLSDARVKQQQQQDFGRDAFAHYVNDYTSTDKAKGSESVISAK